jgi:dTDP-4-dehydrorhamnose reductase
MKVLVFGATGMIGSAMFRVLNADKDLQVWGSIRTERDTKYFRPAEQGQLVAGVDVDKPDALMQIFSKLKPELVVNCIGLTKHHKEAEDPQLALPLNALLPHRMADICALTGARLIHVSTDCVFSGNKGNYSESDMPDSVDLYGKSKHLGEVDYPHALTLRTSTIGHELHSNYGLLEWFLSQHGRCQGFGGAIFSGLPNTEFARVIRDVVILRPELHGLYHVGAAPIDKYELLQLFAKTYAKSIDIGRDDAFRIDRSLDSSRFTKATGYQAPPWPELVQSLYASR